MRCLCMWKTQDNLNCLNCNLIPNWRNYERLKKVISDGGYRGDDLKHLIKNQFSIDFEVRTKDVECKKEFTPIPQRWKVERTFSWLENFRRLSMDYEYHIDSFEAMVKIAAIKIAFKKN